MWARWSEPLVALGVLVGMALLGLAAVSVWPSTQTARIPSGATIYEDVIDPSYAGDGCAWQRTESAEVQIRDCGDKWQQERTIYDHGRKTIYRTSVGPPLNVLARPTATPTRSPTNYGGRP